MWVPAGELQNADPRQMMARLQSDLNRMGITAASGYVLAGLHAEFDVRREGYDFHYHLIAAGEKARLLRKLRKRGKYKARRKQPWEVGLKNCARVRISKKPLFNLPEPITYIAQSNYPHRPTKLHDDGTVTRSKFRYRIPEPFHTDWLLWMDRWSIDDITLLNGLEVTHDGFKLTRP